ncbi:MAG: 2-hydroxy-3-oxopropionate reductase [Phycisphaerae bacterium]|nr:2-hydroxy-3-oxopropionate reductase [Phycisphaerae bacterium]
MSQPVQRVGYVGMGIMGSAMAANLLKAGYDVTVYNRTREKCRPLADAGAKVADSPAALAEAGCEAIFLNVTDTPDVEAVLFGPGGVAGKARAGLIVVDHSTINPVATQAFAARLAERGVTLLDAPVSGGDTGARAGTLSIMVGGDAAAFERVRPLLEAMGKKIVRVGGPGMGQVCKACNQVAVSVNLLGVCEALALARRSGLDLGKMIEVVGGGAAASWQLSNLGPKIAAGDMAPGFMIDLVLKDLKIVADTARSQKLPLSGTAAAEGYFRAAAAGGHGRDGTQAMSTTVEQLGHFSYTE